MPQAWRLSGPLDIKALRLAFEALLFRHETLRTGFTYVKGQPRQIVFPGDGLLLPVIDVMGTQDPEARLWSLVQKEARCPFQLDSGQVARLHLFRLSAEDHVLLINLHHLVADEWSLNLFVRELADLYGTCLSGHPVSRHELPIQYADFSVWQRQRFDSGSTHLQLEYWRHRLRGPLTVLALPTDYARLSRPSGRGATLFAELPKELSTDLKELARSQGATLFMILLAAFKVLLHRYTRQTDITIGSPVAGRDNLETEGLIGLFVNTLALRTDVGDDPTLLELIGRVKETVLGAYANQDAPLEKVVEAISHTREQGHHPLFDVIFGLQPGWVNAPVFEGLNASCIEIDNGGAKFDWTLLLTETDRGIRVRSEYSTDLFERATVANRLEHFKNLLHAIASQPARPISELPLISTAERCRLLAGSSATRASPTPLLCLHDWFGRQAHLTPDALAVSHGGNSVSYRDLNVRANVLANYLRGLGVGPEVPVALCLERSIEMIVSILGVLKAGGVYVPIDPGYPRERIEFMLTDSGARVVLTQKTLRDSLPSIASQVLCLDSDVAELATGAEVEPCSHAKPDNAAYIIYTSGSTGKPKGVVVTHQNVVRLFAQTDQWFRFGQNDVWTLFHSYAFDFSVWEMWGALLYGGRLVIVPYLVSRSPAEFYRLLAAERVTILNQTPSAFRQLVWAEQTMGLSPELNLRFVIFGGEALELQSLKPWFERHGEDRPRLVNMYGITETTVHVTYREIRKADLTSGVGSVLGVPIPDLRVYLLDERLEPVPEGIPGEICVSGSGLARGYLNRPELTAQRFVRNPFGAQANEKLYRSGDLARTNPKGELEYLGRIDNQVKIRGFRIELGEIESALNRHPDLRECAVVARESNQGSPQLIAYIVAKGRTPVRAELCRFLRGVLPEYMIPAVFVPLNALPLTANGKVDRRALPTPSVTGDESLHPPAPDSLEGKLSAIWCELLGCPSVSTEDNFFSLGGHSLLATQVISRIGSSLNLDLSVALLFEAPTVASLAQAIRRIQREQPTSRSSIPLRNSGGNAQEVLGRLDHLTEADLDELLRETESLKF